MKKIGFHEIRPDVHVTFLRFKVFSSRGVNLIFEILDLTCKATTNIKLCGYDFCSHITSFRSCSVAQIIHCIKTDVGCDCITFVRWDSRTHWS